MLHQVEELPGSNRGGTQGRTQGDSPSVLGNEEHKGTVPPCSSGVIRY